MNFSKTVLVMCLPFVFAGCANYDDSGCLKSKSHFEKTLYNMYVENNVNAAVADRLAKYGAEKFDLSKVCITEEMLEDVTQFDSFK